MALTAAFAMGCGGGDSGGIPDDNLVDSGTELDSSTGEVDTDTGSNDTGSFELDSGTPDTGKPETAPDTSIVDTGPPDTGPADTGPADTGPVDTGMTCEAGTSCDVTNKCFTGKTLEATCACTGGTAVSCDDTNACTVDSCDPTTGCKNTNAADGTSCGSGKKCIAGACTDLCTVGASCDDANACTTGEKFDATCACNGGTAVTCNDSNPCTADSCAPATGCTTTPTAEGMSPAGCATPSTCKAGVCTAPLPKPTVTFVTPTEGFVETFTASSAVCDGLLFTVNVTAAAGFQSVSWHLFTPTGTAQMGGASCGAPATALPPWRTTFGNPIYPFKMAEAELTGKTAATFSENIDVNGNYSGIAPWLFCTAPGTGGTAAATGLDGSAIPAASPAAGALRALANYCYSKNTTNAPERQWTLVVRVIDKAGVVETAERKFIVQG